jgi:hypothetical protein
MSRLASALRSNSWSAAILAAAAASVLLVLVASPRMDEAPQYDEIFHILAARGLLTDGSPTIADGEYRRALLYTHQVAMAFSAFGDSLRAARLPSMLAAIGLVGLLGVWLTRRHGALAGLATGVFLATSSIFVDLALFIRFYALQLFCVAVFALAVFAATDSKEKSSRRYLWALAGTAAALVALNVASWISAIAMAAIGSGIVLAWVDERWVTLRAYFDSREKIVLLAAAALLVSVFGGLAFWQLGLLDLARSASLWATPRADSFGYYVGKFGSESSLLWPLWPAAVLVTFHTNRRLAIFCATTVLMGLLVHSLIAQKALRYAAHLWPLICIVLGCAAAQVVIWGGRKMQDGGLRGWGPLVAVLTLGLTLALSEQGRFAAKAIVGTRAEPHVSMETDPSWNEVVPIVKRHLSATDTLVVSNSMKALYYFGDYDYDLSATIVAETETGEEFGRDPRTGRRAISRPESFERVLRQSSRLLLVIEDGKFGWFSGVPGNVADMIRVRCKPVAHVQASNVAVWTCEGGAG